MICRIKLFAAIIWFLLVIIFLFLFTGNSFSVIVFWCWMFISCSVSTSFDFLLAWFEGVELLAFASWKDFCCLSLNLFIAWFLVFLFTILLNHFQIQLINLKNIKRISHYLYKEFVTTHNLSNKIIIYISDESMGQFKSTVDLYA